MTLYTYSICTGNLLYEVDGTPTQFIMRTDHAEAVAELLRMTKLNEIEFKHKVFTELISNDFGYTCCLDYHTADYYLYNNVEPDGISPEETPEALIEDYFTTMLHREQKGHGFGMEELLKELRLECDDCLDLFKKL